MVHPYLRYDEAWMPFPYEPALAYLHGFGGFIGNFISDFETLHDAPHLLAHQKPIFKLDLNSNLL
jgi:hypothetical protein